jgi:hypothetical protein
MLKSCFLYYLEQDFILPISETLKIKIIHNEHTTKQLAAFGRLDIMDDFAKMSLGQKNHAYVITIEETYELEMRF